MLQFCGCRGLFTSSIAACGAGSSTTPCTNVKSQIPLFLSLSFFPVMRWSWPGILWTDKSISNISHGLLIYMDSEQKFQVYHSWLLFIFKITNQVKRCSYANAINLRFWLWFCYINRYLTMYLWLSTWNNDVTEHQFVENKSA